MSINLPDAHKMVGELDLDNEEKWGFFNYLMELCVNPQFLGSQMLFVYAMIVVGCRERQHYGWTPNSFETIVGSSNSSIEILMHLLKNDYCQMWTTIYCTDCSMGYISVPLDNMREYVLDSRCPRCGGGLVDRFIYYVFDPRLIPWEIDVPFYPYVRYDKDGTRHSKRPGA